MSQKAPSDPIPLAKPELGREEEEACLRVLRSQVLVQGPEGEAFEEEFASRIGAKYAIAVSSGTTALQLCLMALSVQPDQEVVIPAFTFIATANAVALSGAQLILADVEEHSWNLCARSLQSVLSSNTAIVIPVHQYGLPANVAKIRDVAGSAVIVEDAACAVGAQTDPIHEVGGANSQLACFSFHPRKVITTGEGGMITTNETAWAHRLRSLRQHGQRGNRIVEPGTNFRMSELAAAIGRVQLRKLDRLVDQRQRAAQAYQNQLADIPWIELPGVGASNHIFQSYVIRLNQQAPIARQTLIEGLRRRGIESQAGVLPIHHHPPYTGVRRAALPIAERLGHDTVFLPMYAGLTASAIDHICQTIRKVAKPPSGRRPQG